MNKYYKKVKKKKKKKKKKVVIRQQEGPKQLKRIVASIYKAYKHTINEKKEKKLGHLSTNLVHIINIYTEREKKRDKKAQ